ncbi:MAG: hypothetical protein FJ399_17985 [Verrucomicrobia bacterium]|nr:hypothetical protein [Verrucomicrobiota bacterium]
MPAAGGLRLRRGVFESPEEIVGVCVLASLRMAAVGGCWFPLEIAPEWMKLLARTVPTGLSGSGQSAASRADDHQPSRAAPSTG